MSAPTSTRSPRSALPSIELAAFDGAEDLVHAWRSGLTPDPALTVSAWADTHRWLSSRAAAEPGRYRTDRTPYMRAIMDALSPSDPVQRVVFMKAAQVGAAEAGNCFIGFVMHHAPGPMLAVQPTVELARAVAERLNSIGRTPPAIIRTRASLLRRNRRRMLSAELPPAHRSADRGTPGA